ncbi:hypothetical protein DFH06DRAFT_1414801 [Mycena polygramma]|nr:hypothetical protein DFH06DRAFT_1414801 [Mycena polygramma]
MDAISSWKHPKLERGPGASKSQHSRPPRWWDRHLAEPLTLKRIVFADGVGQHLVQLFEAIVARLWHPPQVVPQQLTARMASYLDFLDMSSRNRYLDNEGQLEVFHSAIAPPFCEVASNLFLAHLLVEHPDAFEPSTFEWDVSFISQTKASGAAPLTDLIDTVAFLTDDSHHVHIPIPLRSIVERMALCKLINTEAKFNSVANDGVRKAVEALDGKDFPWEACAGPEAPDHTERDGHAEHNPTCTADSDTCERLVAQLLATPPTDGSGLSQPAASSSSSQPTASSSSQPAASSSSPQPAPNRDRLRRKTRPVDYTAGLVDEDEDATRSKRRKLDDDGNPAAEATGASKTARAWFQQTWAQSVYIDSTFLRCLAMNWELVGLRHRASRTLFLARLQPHVPGSPFSDGYGKVQIALKLAALIDWCERHPDITAGGNHESEDRGDEGRREGPRDAEGPGEEGRGGPGEDDHREGPGNEDGGGAGLGGEECRGQGRGNEDGGGEGLGGEERRGQGRGNEDGGGEGLGGEERRGQGRGNEERRGQGRGNEDGGREGLRGAERRGQSRGIGGYKDRADEDHVAEWRGDGTNGRWSRPAQGDSDEQYEPLATANSSARGPPYSNADKENWPLLKIDGEQKQAFLVPAPAAPPHTLRVWVQFDPFNSPKPARFVSAIDAQDRSPEQLANDPSLWKGSAGGVDVYLRHAIVPGFACGGVMGPLDSQTPVFVKLAFPDIEGQVEHLTHEYRVYQELGSIHGIPLCTGLYHTVDEGGPRVLVLKHCGCSLEDIGGNSSSFQLTMEQKNSFLRILMDIHRAGYVHNDIAVRNLLLSSTGEPVITDFGLSKKGTPQWMDEEIQALKALLFYQ